MTVRFYLAANSSPEWVQVAQQRIVELEALGWTCAFDWTRVVHEPDRLWTRLADRDVRAVSRCDVFVLLADTETPGGMCELGVRLGVRPRKRAYVVGGKHFFFHHRQVIRCKDWATFLDLASRSVRP